jgi:hypothetical protein
MKVAKKNLSIFRQVKKKYFLMNAHKHFIIQKLLFRSKFINFRKNVKFLNKLIQYKYDKKYTNAKTLLSIANHIRTYNYLKTLRKKKTNNKINSQLTNKMIIFRRKLKLRLNKWSVSNSNKYKFNKSFQNLKKAVNYETKFNFIKKNNNDKKEIFKIQKRNFHPPKKNYPVFYSSTGLDNNNRKNLNKDSNTIVKKGTKVSMTDTKNNYPFYLSKNKALKTMKKRKRHRKFLFLKKIKFK